MGDNKYFYRAAVEKDKPAITVANNKTKQLFQPHFDKVWDYYKHEFQTKIFELKEDLLSFFYVVYPDDVPWDGEKMLKMLKENECLFLRVHSFIDHPDYPFTNSDLLHLKEYGYEAEKSFEFDDCRKNLSTPDQLEKEFGKVSSLLVGLFFSSDANQKRTDTIKEVLSKINDHFSSLLISIEAREAQFSNATGI